VDRILHPAGSIVAIKLLRFWSLFHFEHEEAGG
jgi:hypothetical protein